MNRHVNAISGRLSLRAPLRDSLEILARIADIIPLNKELDVTAAVKLIVPWPVASWVSMGLKTISTPLIRWETPMAYSTPQKTAT